MRTPIGFGLVGLLAATPAFAARHEVSGEFRVTFAPASPLTRTLYASGLAGGGIRAGYAVLRNERRVGLVVRGAWGMSRTDGAVDVDSLEGVDSADVRFTTNRMTVGAKLDVEVRGFFYPYVAVDVGAAVGRLRLASPGSDRDPVRETAATGLGGAVIGTEWMVPDRALNAAATGAIYVEGGYEGAGSLRFADSGGATPIGGPVFRAGVGVRF